MTKEEQIVAGLEFFAATYGDISISKGFESELGEHYKVVVSEGGLLDGWKKDNEALGDDDIHGLYNAVMQLMTKHRDVAHQQAKFLDAQIKGYKAWKESDEPLTRDANL